MKTSCEKQEPIRQEEKAKVQTTKSQIKGPKERKSKKKKKKIEKTTETRFLQVLGERGKPKSVAELCPDSTFCKQTESALSSRWLVP